MFGSSSPSLSTRNQFELNYSLRAQRYLYTSIRILTRFWHEHTHAFLQRGGNFGVVDNLRKVGRTNLFFTFTDKHEIHRQLCSRSLEGMKSAEEGRFGTFLVHSASADADPAQPFLVHDPPFERWRRPLRWVELFHVVHKIDADGSRRTCIQSAEDPRLA
jgi:hypothetical protein